MKRKTLKSGWAIVNGRGDMPADNYMVIYGSRKQCAAWVRIRKQWNEALSERPVRVDVVVRTQTKRKKR